MTVYVPPKRYLTDRVRCFYCEEEMNDHEPHLVTMQLVNGYPDVCEMTGRVTTQYWRTKGIHPWISKDVWYENIWEVR